MATVPVSTNTTSGTKQHDDNYRHGRATAPVGGEKIVGKW